MPRVPRLDGRQHGLRAFELLKAYLRLEHHDKAQRHAQLGAVPDATSASADSTHASEQSAARHSPPDLFRLMPQHDIHVPHQQNGVDCGLYMLQFIEKIAQVLPDLAAAKQRRSGQLQEAHSDPRPPESDPTATRPI